MMMYGRPIRPDYSAAVCRSGHIVDRCVVDPDNQIAVHPGGRPEPMKVPAFCTKCGSPTLFRCPSCSTPLPGGPIWGDRGPDQFCGNCGASFPWTDRDTMIAHLSDLLKNERLNAHDQLEAQEALLVLTEPDDDSPADVKERAADKLKRYASDAWLNLAAPVLRGLLTLELQRRLGLPPG